MIWIISGKDNTKVEKCLSALKGVHLSRFFMYSFLLHSSSVFSTLLILMPSYNCHLRRPPAWTVLQTTIYCSQAQEHQCHYRDLIDTKKKTEHFSPVSDTWPKRTQPCSVLFFLLLFQRRKPPHFITKIVFRSGKKWVILHKTLLRSLTTSFGALLFPSQHLRNEHKNWTTQPLTECDAASSQVFFSFGAR